MSMIFGQRLAAGVHLEDLGATLASGRSDGDLAVEAPGGASSAGSRMSGRLVAAIMMMLSLASKPSISTEQLVERLLALVVAAASPAPRWRRRRRSHP